MPAFALHTHTVSRWTKILLLAAMAFFFTLVVFNNVTDFGSNYAFVRHTLSMDTTFPGNQGMWRAITNPTLQLVLYLAIIAWEAINMTLCWCGAIALWRALHAMPESFHHAKRIGILAVTSGMLMWFVAFTCVGAEWFLMWQSHQWNGQDPAFRMFITEAVVLLLLQMPEPHMHATESIR
jgi:predicted small integral membrane protein